ncbi:MAG: hypothetical protein AB4042_16265 [Leptolyngbyaceae cyanobacterium]
MFPFWSMSGESTCSSTDYRAKRLRCLRWVKDSLETRLAAVNAMIDSLEQQQQRDEQEVA